MTRRVQNDREGHRCPTCDPVQEVRFFGRDSDPFVMLVRRRVTVNGRSVFVDSVVIHKPLHERVTSSGGLR